MATPRIGDVVDGYTYKGGDPNDQNSWEQAAAAVPSRRVEASVLPLPKIGELVDGYRYTGGDLNARESWSDAPLNEPVAAARGIGEAALTIGSGIVAQPMAGVAGLAATGYEALKGNPNPQDAGAAVVKGVQERMTFAPRTPEGKQALGKIGRAVAPVAGVVSRATPQATHALGELGAVIGGETGRKVGAAIGSITPTALLFLMGGPPQEPGVQTTMQRFRGEMPTLAPIPGAQPGGYTAAQRASEAATVEQPPPASVPEMTKIAQQMKAGKAEEVAAAVNPDPELEAIRQRLGIEVNPDVVSRNETFRQLMAGMKARNVALREKEANAIAQTKVLADQLIDDTGGSVDRSIFDIKLKDQLSTVNKALEQQSDDLYTAVRTAIPKNSAINPTELRTYIDQRISDLGGRPELLNKIDKRIYRLIGQAPSEAEIAAAAAEGVPPPMPPPVTYHALDALRQDIGLGYRRLGPFKDLGKGDLDQAYGILSQQQHGVARLYGVDDVLTAAQTLIGQRKTLEANTIGLYGKNWEAGTVNPRVAAAARDLTAGNTATFNKLLDSVPEDLRGQAASQVLNDILTAGSRGGNNVGGGFATAYAGLSRNKGAMDALLKELPEASRQRFTDLGRFSQAMYRAMANNNHSRSAVVAFDALNDPSTIAKLWGAAKEAPVIGPTVVKPITHVVHTLRGIAGEPKTGTQLADDLIASTRFQDALERAATTGDAAAADAAIRTLPVYQEWLKSQPDAATISKMGVVSWLTNSSAQANTADTPATPKNINDMSALPSGSYYINPADSRIYRKK